MKNDLLDLAEWSIKTTKAAGADECRVGITSGRSVEIGYRERKPETIKEASTKRLFVEVFAYKRYSGQNTSDLREDALKEFFKNAVATTKLLAEDPYRTLPNPRYYEGRSQLELNLVDPDYEKVTPEERHAMAKAIEDVCLTKGGSKVVSVQSSVSDDRTESVLLASNGFQGRSASTSYSAVASVTLQDEGDRRPNGYAWAVTVARKSLPPAAQIGEEATRRTFDLLGGKKIKTETLPVIIENRNVPEMVGGLLGPMFARSIQQKRSFLADKQGKKIASEHLTLIDDPLMPGSLGSRSYDGEGIAAKRRVMVEAGVLREFFVDWYYGRKLGWEPTTADPSNLVIPPGKRSIKEIMKDLGRGILVTGFIGGNSNSTTGDTSVGIFGHLFEHGEAVQAVAEMNIADNHLKFWQRLAEVGNDPWIYSSFRMPSLVFTDVVVSGV